MYCRVCGEADATFKPSKRQSLCDSCGKETPKKATRKSFDAYYWGKNFEEVPLGIRREFYSDYLTSGYTMSQYKEETTNSL